MLIWLRKPRVADAALTGVGVDGNVIRREEGARLISLDDGFAMLDEARFAIDKERAEAQQQMQQEAQQIYARAQQEGEEQGRQLALEQWYERTLGTLADYCAIQKRMRERLAELVASAVEHIVHVEDSKGLFLRALSSLDQIAEGASFLTVSVNRNDFAAAQQAFDGFALEWSRRGQPIKVVVHADKELAEGSCICESEFGIVDASLHTQIQAMRAALERALESGISEEINEKIGEDIEGITEKVIEEINEEMSELEQNLHDVESLAAPVPSLVSDEIEIEGELIASKKTKTKTVTKSKAASKTSAKSKLKADSNTETNEVEPSLDAVAKPKRKRKPKATVLPQTE